MGSLWSSVHTWVLLCLFSSIEMDKYVHLLENAAEKMEGSCVKINCTYDLQADMKVFWLKDYNWNAPEKEFQGTVVFSNTKERPQAPEYFNRVEFLHVNNYYGNAVCSLKINNLRKNDSGNYAFRFIKGDHRYKSEDFNLTVTDNKCIVHIKPLYKSPKDGDNLILQCATPAICEVFPIWQSPDMVFSENKREENEKLSELNLTVSWRDDGKTLTCRSPGSYNDNCLENNFTLRVEYAPQETVVIEGSVLTVKENENVMASCTSKANPKAEFTWFKHNSSKSWLGENLTIDNIKSEDKGVFYCRAKNIHGENKSLNITLNVIYAPKGVTISAKSPTLKEGDRLELTCLVQNSNPGGENVAYRWYKNYKEIESQIKNTFTVLRIKRRDGGHYQCQARNSVGETNSNIVEVFVKFAPQNTKIEGVKEIKLGFKLSLTCLTEADPNPKNYYWYFKPEYETLFHTISKKQQVYQIEEVAVSNSGSYKCSAANILGTGGNSTEFSVLVLYPPNKPNLTMTQIVKEAEQYFIKCAVESSPQASLTLSVSSVSNPERNRIIRNNTSQSNFLTFSDTADVSDAGEYTCIAKNSEGENSSKNDLIVWYAPKNVQISAHPGKELSEGSNLTLNCTADSVPRVNAYKWEKSIGTHSVTVGHEQTLRLHFLKLSDSDHYRCISENVMGRSNSSALYIRVKYRPRITIIHNMTSLGLLEDAVPVHLSCSVHCDPPAKSFGWYMLEKNKTALSNNQNYTVQPHNPGTYYCIASNTEGESRSQNIKIYFNRFIIKLLIQIIISLLVIILLIGALFFLLRIIIRKRSSGENDSPQRIFFFSGCLLWPLSKFQSSGSRNNTRETLVTEESDELSVFRDNNVHPNCPPNRMNPNCNIHTVYDAIHLPPSMTKRHNTEEDLNMTTVNYAMLQFADSNNPNKSVPTSDSCGPIYAKVLKNQQMSKEQGKDLGDYENVSGAYNPKQPFPNWDSDTSESEEEVDYTKVTFTVTTHNKPQMDPLSMEEEDKTDYSEVKI